MGTKIPGSDLILVRSIRTAAHKLEDGYGIDIPGWNEWAWGKSWEEAIRDFLTSLRDGLSILTKMESELNDHEGARLRMFRHHIGREG